MKVLCIEIKYIFIWSYGIIYNIYYFYGLVSSTKQQLKPRDISRNVENVCYFVGSLDWTKQVHRARGGKQASTACRKC